MPLFNVGDKVHKKENSDKIYIVKKRTDIAYCIPNYILIDEKGKEFNNFCVGWVKWVTPNDTLRYGEVLTDDRYTLDVSWHYRIRTIRYESRIFYHKMINGEVVEFKELTV